MKTDIRLGALVDVEDPGTGEWITVAHHPTEEAAEKERAEWESIGYSAMLSCACGSYAYGECELCILWADALRHEVVQ